MTNKSENKVIIKKYLNRRLYNTQTSTYITHEGIAEMVKNKISFIVIDAKTEEDITKSVLIQLIFDQETKGYNLLSNEILQEIVNFYEFQNANQNLTKYFENLIKFYNIEQNLADDENSENNDIYTPASFLEDMTRQNVNMMKNIFQNFYEGFKVNNDK